MPGRSLAPHLPWARAIRRARWPAEIRPHASDPAPDRTLRVGFLSPDFRDHPVGQSLLPLFSHHDRRQTEIVGYGDVRVPDRVTARLKTLADHWHSTVGLSDRQVAERIRTDGIDILVDLALHTANNRLLVFARRPAPVQVTMLGMPGTTGLSTIDYRLTDPYLDPPGATDGDYTEQSIRLPRGYWCYQAPGGRRPPVSALPALANGFVTFGCLNQFAKVSAPALQAWMTILQSLPASRLVIHSQPGSHLEAVRRVFEDGGIASERVEFAGRVPRVAYLDRYHDLDLSLDQFPYNGGVSTMDSLWMGVPVVTLAGHRGGSFGGKHPVERGPAGADRGDCPAVRRLCHRLGPRPRAARPDSIGIEATDERLGAHGRPAIRRRRRIGVSADVEGLVRAGSVFGYVRISLTTRPSTSVRRKLRPL